MGTTGTETHFLTEKEVEELAMAQQRQEEVWCVCVYLWQSFVCL